MRLVFTAIFALLALSLAAPITIQPAAAQETCRCKGCGCKGGPGWRGPDGACVAKAKLAEICGTPAGTPCTQEAATRVCFGKQSALSATR